MPAYLRNVPITELKDLAIHEIRIGSEYVSKCGPYGAITIHASNGMYVLYNRQGELLLGKILKQNGE